jgi:NAD(P)-dependent dehydrogenase (short-subunit alcohol dehydrogenase family)
MATALVTGANRGIGLALCQRLDTDGHRVVAVCRHASPALDELGAITIDGIDVADAASIDALPRLLHKASVDRVDIVINNAGVMARHALGELDAEGIDAMRWQFDVNAIGPVLVSRTLAPMIPDGGKIGIVTSRMGSIADNTSGGYYGYRMSKAAVNIAGVSLARDLADRGIAVALLHPGYVRTDMTGGAGYIDVDEAAAGIVSVMDRLTKDNSGRFWHSNGEELPW